MTETETLIEKIEELSTKLATEKQKHQETHYELRELNNKLWIENSYITTSIFLGILLFFLLVCYPTYMSFTTPNNPTYCYIEINKEHNDSFSLYQNILWHIDTQVGNFSSLDSAIDAAKKIQCELKPDEARK